MKLKHVLFAVLLASQPFVGNMVMAGEKVAAATVTPAKQNESSKLNINTATAEQFMELKGIGKKKADAIIAWRTQHGKFTTIEQMSEVIGISEKFVTAHKAELTIN
jgi:competence protein ComEA helix-hairpin-helix repeat region